MSVYFLKGSEVPLILTNSPHTEQAFYRQQSFRKEIYMSDRYLILRISPHGANIALKLLSLPMQ